MMLPTSSIAALAVLSSAVQALPIPHPVRLYRRAGPVMPKNGYKSDRAPPAQWAYEQLEPYVQYHFRYLAVGCAEQHDTTFFESCCHPRMAADTDANHPSQCALSAHVKGGKKVESKLEKEMAVAGAQASKVRQAQIASVSGVPSEAVSATSKKPHVAITVVSSEKPGPTTSKKVEVTSASPKVETTSKVEETTSVHVPETTSVHVEATSSAPPKKPEVTTSSKPSLKPEPTTSSSSSSEAPKPTKSSSDDSGSDGGSVLDWVLDDAFATWYTQAGTIGACGSLNGPEFNQVIPDSSKVIAMETTLFGTGSNYGQNCGRTIEIVNLENGKTVQAMVNDECPTCSSTNSLDLSKGAFEEIATFERGMPPIKWRFVN